MSYDAIMSKFALVGKGTDMEAHMGTIRDYSNQCETAVEFGVYDCTSTWAILAGKPKKLTSYDIYRRPEVDEVEQAATDSGIDFKFVLGSSLDAKLEETDLLFIDSLHMYAQLKKELALHATKIRKFIMMHDTTLFEFVDQDGQKNGLWPAIQEFLDANHCWKLHKRVTHCHGLTVLSRS